MKMLRHARSYRENFNRHSFWRSAPYQMVLYIAVASFVIAQATADFAIRRANLGLLAIAYGLSFEVAMIGIRNWREKQRVSERDRETDDKALVKNDH